MDKWIEQRRIQQSKNEQQDLLDKYGWYMHYVFDKNGEYNGLSNIHTHGLKESFNHLDLQAALPLRPEIIHLVFSTIIEHIKNGIVFLPNSSSDEVIQWYAVYFKEFTENGRSVLRVIFPELGENFLTMKIETKYINNN